MGMGWAAPPPPPPRPSALANLTEDELRRLEGTERRNVEARLLLLREIQAMLDASVLLMQQYSAVANLQNSANVATQTDLAGEPAEAPTSAARPDAAPGPSGSGPGPSGSGPGPVLSARPPSPPPEASKAPHAPTLRPAALDTDREKTDADAEELRRRRLQKFTLDK